MATERVVLTYEDYAALPNDGRRYEVHDGELSVTPAPGRRHQTTIGFRSTGSSTPTHGRSRHTNSLTLATGW
jgi:Uma2 family endonuclease